MSSSNKVFLSLHSDWSRVEFPCVKDDTHLHIVVKSPIPKSKLQEVVNYAERFKCVSLVVSHCIDNKYDLSFLECFPGLNSFALMAHLFTDFNQLSYIPEGIEEITINATNSSKMSLGFLKRFSCLKSIRLEKQTKDIAVISELKKLEKIAIRSITLSDLSIMSSLPSLNALEIRLGGTTNLALLPELKSLEYLELWAINKLGNIDSVADAISLKKIYLDQLKNVKNVSSFRMLTELKWLGLCRMSGLTSLQWAADAPALSNLSVTETTHLEKSKFEPFVGHKALKAADIYIGKKYSVEVRHMLGLPEIAKL